MAGLPPQFSLAELMGRNMSGQTANSVAAMAGPYVGGLPALMPPDPTRVFNNPALAQRLRAVSLAEQLAALNQRLAPRVAPVGGFPMGPAQTFGTAVTPYQAPLVPARVPGTAVVPTGSTAVVPTRTLGALIPDEVITDVNATINRPAPLDARVRPTLTPNAPNGPNVPPNAPNGPNPQNVTRVRPTLTPNAPTVANVVPDARVRPTLTPAVQNVTNVVDDVAGKQWWQRLFPGMKAAPSLMRGGLGLGAGLVADKAIGGLGDLIVGGEAEDYGFSWGGLGKAAAAGAGAGAVGGLVTSGGAFSLPMTAIGGLLGAGSYLLSEKEWADKEVDIEAEKAKMQGFVGQYGIDPTLAKQVIGNYDLMANVYMQDKELRGQLKDLTRQSMTSLAGLIGQRSQMMSPEQAEWMSSFALEQLQPYYSQISENSPYKVAALQQMAAIPANISLQSLISPQAMGMMDASSAPAALAAGLSPEQIKQLENA